MKIVRPLAIDDASLVSFNVAETETQWSSGSTYAAGDIRRGTGDYAHKLYASAQGSNTNHAVTDAAWWTELGASAAWRGFDQSPGSQVTNPNLITFQYQATGRLNVLAFQNMNAQSIRATATDASAGLIFDQTFSMVSTAGISGDDCFWLYCTEPITRVADRAIILPTALYSDLLIEVTVADPGASPAMGEFIPGFYRDLGGTKWSPTVGVQDFSTKDQDSFGGYHPVERPYAKTASFQANVAASQVDKVLDLLAGYRATPLLFIGDEDYAATQIYGFIRDFGIEIAGPSASLLYLEIEGLA